MNNEILQNTLHDLNIPEFIQRADSATLVRMIAARQNEDTSQPTPEKLSRYGFVYEKQGITAFNSFKAQQENAEREKMQNNFRYAYTCWRTLLFLPDEAESQEPINGHVSLRGIHIVDEAFHEELLDAELCLAFRLSIAGLLSGRIAETRLDLTRFLKTDSGLPDNHEQSWRSMVAANIFGAFVRLVRKSNGWEDIQLALQSIQRLREMQKAYEETYLEQLEDPEQQETAAWILMGFYHLAQLITLTGEYLQKGEPASTKVGTQLDSLHDRAVEALEAGNEPLQAHLADLLWAGCRELVQNAIWTSTRRLGELVQQYVRMITSSAKNHPVIELWPGQQEAFRSHLLDVFQRVILIEMPTSAGKTLLAKFVIIQTKALNPHGLVAYIVPTRALVNQITLDLRSDFRHMWKVEQAVPAFEIDPTEERLLNQQIDVLVTTPEKLDLLVRSEHPIVKNMALIVADEAHALNDGERGARLELLLGTIKRDFARSRFLLLSPFLPNPQELVQWLGDDLPLAPLAIDWKPNRKLVGTIQSKKNQDGWFLEFETYASAHTPDIRAGMKVPLGNNSARLTTISALSREAVQKMLGRGSILVLCRGPLKAVERAIQIAEERELIVEDARLDAICHYIEAELGRGNNLVHCLRRGVTFHHSGLSTETRWLIEDLIREGIVTIICGTTTLAQGMNFPISTVIVETLLKGRNGRFSFHDFWNIAGRAGRTLVDSLGVVVFPAPTAMKQAEFREFLEKDAEEIASQLIELILSLNTHNFSFSLQSLRTHPELSPLLQFLAHAMRVSGTLNLADEVEDLLRSSLVYHQVQRRNQVAARSLIRLCQSYLNQISRQRNILGIADRTGFATPSVRWLLARKAEARELSFAPNWHPEHLFGEDLRPLTERIAVIADLPEMNLGQMEGGRFDAKRVAAILRAWVNGETLEDMARQYGLPEEDRNKQLTEFSRYLFALLGKTSWGIGALATICLAGNQESVRDESAYVPSMLFFGLRQEEAITLRMAGVPRIFANGLAQIWKQQMSADVDQYETVRKWVTNLSDNDWRRAVPAKTTLTPQDLRLIWNSFSGEG